MLATVLGASLGSPVVASDFKIESTLAKATAALENERFERALNLFLEADRATGGKSPEALIGAAEAAAQNGKSEEALDYVVRALEIADSPALRARGLKARATALLVGEKQPFEIESALLEALAIDSSAARDAQLELARLYNRFGFGRLAYEALRAFDAAGGDFGRAESTWNLTRLSLMTNASYDQCVARLRAAGHAIPEIGGDSKVRPPVFAEGVDARPAKPVKRLNWHYPQNLNGTRVQGDVLLRVLVLPNGEQDCLTVFESPLPDFTREVASAVRAAEFEPASNNGSAIAAHYNIHARFVQVIIRPLGSR